VKFDKKKYMKEYRQKNRKRLSEERKQWAKVHPEKIKDYAHNDYLKHKERVSKQAKVWRKSNRVYLAMRRLKWRLKTLEVLGGKCVRCGFTDVRSLQIDHVAGGGAREIGGLNSVTHNKKVIESYLKNEGKYQLLCANCNWIKRHENNEQSRLSLVEVN
jgi:hypothetical protein